MGLEGRGPMTGRRMRRCVGYDVAGFDHGMNYRYRPGERRGMNHRHENAAHTFPDANIISATKTVGAGIFSNGGMALTVPFGNTGLEMCVEGHSLPDVAKR